MPDRLAEIESKCVRFKLCQPEIEDYHWLIAEVKRLRKFRDELTTEYWNCYEPDVRLNALSEIITRRENV